MSDEQKLDPVITPDLAAHPLEQEEDFRVPVRYAERPKWEYLAVMVSYPAGDTADLTDQFNEYGLQGWDLADTQAPVSGGSMQARPKMTMQVIFKREKYDTVGEAPELLLEG